MRNAAIALAAFFITAASNGQVYRCGNSYSNQPCPNGRAVDTSPAVSDPNARTTASLYLCNGYNGARFWSQEECSRHRAMTERIEPVPKNLPMEDQARIANQQTQRAYDQAREQREPSNTGVMPARAADRYDCQNYNERAAAWDAQARRPNSAGMQDWIAAQKKEVRDAQFRAGC